MTGHVERCLAADAVHMRSLASMGIKEYQKGPLTAKSGAEGPGAPLAHGSGGSKASQRLTHGCLWTWG
jgi:hypothetical protein